MNFQRACYSYSALQRCADAVKATNWTVRRSAEHFSKSSIYESAGPCAPR